MYGVFLVYTNFYRAGLLGGFRFKLLNLEPDEWMVSPPAAFRVA